MGALLAFLMCVSAIVLLIGLIKPRVVVRWGEKRTRGRVALIYGITTVVLFVLTGVAGQHSSAAPAGSTAVSTTNSTASASSAATSTNASADTSSSTDNQSSGASTDNTASTSAPTWNTSDLDIQKNGNVQTAVELLQGSTTDMRSIATSPAADMVFKEPWTYYGKIVKISGTVGIVQDYPPDSSISQDLGGSASEMAIMASDGTYVDYLLLGDSGNVKVGDTVSMYGYPVGQDNVTNKLGGTTTELVIVGNTYDDPAQ